MNLIRFLYLQRVVGFTVPAAPHFDAPATLAFETLLDTARSYLEFGCGGSTLTVARRGIEALSVESDPYFARLVRRALPPAAPARIIVAPIGLTGEWGFPVFKRPTPRRLRRWRRYIELPFEQLARRGGFPDLVLIDGRFRRACALESARQARLAGKPTILFFDDYADRTHYHEVERYLGRPRMSGQAAIFHVGGELPEIPQAAVAEAIADCR